MRSADLADAAVANANLADNAIDGNKVLDDFLKGSDEPGGEHRGWRD